MAIVREDSTKASAKWSIEPGTEPTSYSDDTKADGRLTPSTAVGITAQVMSSAVPDWLARLRSAAALSRSQELKSTAALRLILSRPAGWVERVMEDVSSSVRIHVADTRQQVQELDEIWRRAWGARAVSLLREALFSDEDWARRVRNFRLSAAAEMAVLDSPIYRLERWLRSQSDSLCDPIRPVKSSLPNAKQVVESIGVTRDLRNVAEYLGRSGSIAAGVLDEAIEEARPALDQQRYLPGIPEAIGSGVRRRLLRSHGFDRGSGPIMAELEGGRRSLIEQYSSRLWYLPAGEINPLFSFDSRESFQTQAADVAAGIARIVFQNDGLMGLVRRFQYVTYNGERVSEADAAELTRRGMGLGAQQAPYVIRGI